MDLNKGLSKDFFDDYLNAKGKSFLEEKGIYYVNDVVLLKLLTKSYTYF